MRVKGTLLSGWKFSWPLWRAARARGSVMLLRRLRAEGAASIGGEGASGEDEMLSGVEGRAKVTVLGLRGLAECVIMVGCCAAIGNAS